MISPINDKSDKWIVIIWKYKLVRIVDFFFINFYIAHNYIIKVQLSGY